jgi:hypothetical protein
VGSVGPHSRRANIAGRDLRCWSCDEELIPGYVNLIGATEMVLVFVEITLACTRCCAVNFVPIADDRESQWKSSLPQSATMLKATPDGAPDRGQ